MTTITISSGVVSSGLVISSGGVLKVLSGAEALDITVTASHDYVYSGGKVSGTQLYGTEVLSGGSATATNIFGLQGGLQLVSAGGVAVSTHVGGRGGEQIIYAGGVASSASVDGAQIVSSGGAAISTTVTGEFGGVQTIASGGVASATMVFGTQVVSSGGLAIATKVFGAEVVSSGGVASATTLRGGTLTLLSGASLARGLIIDAGSAILSGTVAAGQRIHFNGASGALVLDDVADFHAAISGFAGEKLEIGGFAYESATETVSWTQSGASGTLVVSDGTEVASLTLIGAYATNDFTLAADGDGGTLVETPRIISSGVVSRGLVISSGGVLEVLAGGEADAITVTASFDYVYAGGKVSGTQLYGTEVLSGGTATATNIFGLQGGLQIVSSGGVAVSTHVGGEGGEQIIYAGGVARSASVDGAQIVSSGGLAVSTTVSGAQVVSSGGVASVTTLSGGTLTLLSGGSLAGGLVIEAGSAILSGAVAAGETIDFSGVSGALMLDNIRDFHAAISGLGGDKIDLGGFTYHAATETVSWTQSGASGTLVVSDGTRVASLTLIGAYASYEFLLATDGDGGTLVETPELISSGVVSSGLVISSGGVLDVLSGGEAEAITVTGGFDYVYSGGKVSGTQLYGTEVLSGGTATATDIFGRQGGRQLVSAGGVAVSTHVGGVGGEQTIHAGGVARSASVDGTQIIASGGKAVATTVTSQYGGEQIVSSGGLAIATKVFGVEVVSTGGVASATILSGGTLKLLSGGSLAGGLVIEAGSAILSGTVAAGQTIHFTGASGALVLDDTADFDAAISGLARSGQKIDLAGFIYKSSTERVSWTPSGTSGTLTVSDGTKVASLTLIGTYATSNFQLASDGHGGTYVYDPPSTPMAGVAHMAEAMAVVGAGGAAPLTDVGGHLGGSAGMPSAVPAMHSAAVSAGAR